MPIGDRTTHRALPCKECGCERCIRVVFMVLKLPEQVEMDVYEYSCERCCSHKDAWERVIAKWIQEKKAADGENADAGSASR